MKRYLGLPGVGNFDDYPICRPGRGIHLHGALGATRWSTYVCPKTPLDAGRNQVEGTIKVERNATLYATMCRDRHVRRRMRSCRGAAGSTVGGSVQIVQSGAARSIRCTSNGDIYFDENDRFLRQPAMHRRQSPGLPKFGWVSITDNTIDGNCSAGKQPAPPAAEHCEGQQGGSMRQPQAGQDETTQKTYGRIESCLPAG